VGEEAGAGGWGQLLVRVGQGEEEEEEEEEEVVVVVEQRGGRRQLGWRGGGGEREGLRPLPGDYPQGPRGGVGGGILRSHQRGGIRRGRLRPSSVRLLLVLMPCGT
jgi:hypothetical protein